MSYGIGLAIEVSVAALLVLTIVYCVTLNRRLKSLKADEGAMKATIAELVAATTAAERAVGGLRATMKDCESGLDERLRAAQLMAADLELQAKAGDVVLGKLTRIVAAARSAPDLTPDRPLDPRAMAIAAQSLNERARLRLNGLAA